MLHLVDIAGYMAAALTTVGYAPQAIKAYKTRQTKDISLWMYILMLLGILLWLIYGAFHLDWPIIFANVFTLFLVVPILILKIREK